MLNCVFYTADQQSLLRPPYFYVLTLRAGRAVAFLSPKLQQKLRGRLVYQTASRISASDAALQTVLESDIVQAPDFSLRTLTAFIGQAHTVLEAADRVLYTFGFGHDTARTRQAIISGLDSINAANPMAGLLQDFIYFDAQRTSNLALQLVALPLTGRRREFATLTPTAVAIIDARALSDMAVPTPSDYTALRDEDNIEIGEDENSGGVLLWWLVLPVLGAVLMGSLIVTYLRWRQADRQRRRWLKGIAGYPEPLYVPTLHGLRRRELREIDRCDVIMHKIVDIGTFGQVYQATLTGSAAGSHPVKIVIKLWQTAANISVLGITPNREQYIGPLLREYAVLAQFAGEPRIMQVYGVVVNDNRPLGVALEYCSQGNLSCVLARRRLSLATKLRLAGEIAEGMEVVGRAGAMHLELATRHIYVTADMHCKLGQIGAAAMGKVTKEVKGPIFFVLLCRRGQHAPGVLRESHAVTKCPVGEEVT